MFKGQISRAAQGTAGARPPPIDGNEISLLNCQYLIPPARGAGRTTTGGGALTLQDWASSAGDGRRREPGPHLPAEAQEDPTAGLAQHNPFQPVGGGALIPSSRVAENAGQAPTALFVGASGAGRLGLPGWRLYGGGAGRADIVHSGGLGQPGSPTGVTLAVEAALACRRPPSPRTKSPVLNLPLTPTRQPALAKAHPPSCTSTARRQRLPSKQG